EGGGAKWGLGGQEAEATQQLFAPGDWYGHIPEPIAYGVLVMLLREVKDHGARPGSSPWFWRRRPIRPGACITVSRQTPSCLPDSKTAWNRLTDMSSGCRRLPPRMILAMWPPMLAYLRPSRQRCHGVSPSSRESSSSTRTTARPCWSPFANTCHRVLGFTWRTMAASAYPKRAPRR